MSDPKFPKVARSHHWEVVARYIHNMWCMMVKDILNNFTPQNVERWKRLANTKWKDLSEEDKDKRYTWARQIFNLIGFTKM